MVTKCMIWFYHILQCALFKLHNSTVWNCQEFKVKWAILVQNQSAKMSVRDAKYSLMSRDNNKKCIYLWSSYQQLLIFIFKFCNDKVSQSLCWSRKTNDAVCILQLYYKDIWICIAYFINTMFSVWKRGFLERKDHWKGKESRGTSQKVQGHQSPSDQGFYPPRVQKSGATKIEDGDSLDTRKKVKRNGPVWFLRPSLWNFGCTLLIKLSS